MTAVKTYNLRVTNLRTDESVDIFGSEHGLFHWSPPVRGFGQADVRWSGDVYSGADGGYISDQKYGMRQIPITAVLSSNNYEDFADMVARIYRVFEIRDDLRVELFTPTGRVYSVNAKLTKSVDPDIVYPLLADYDIELVAEDPRIYDFTAGAALEVTLEKPSLGGLLWETNGLISFLWEASGGGALVNNAGSTKVWPIVEIRGAAINPLVTNNTTNQTVSLNLTTNAPDVIRIDMFRNEVTLNGTNIFNNLGMDEFWPLLPGLNDVVYNSQSPSDTATAKVIWFNGYMGVA